MESIEEEQEETDINLDFLDELFIFGA